MQFRLMMLFVGAGFHLAQAQPGVMSPSTPEPRAFTLDANLGVGLTRVTNIPADGDTRYSDPALMASTSASAGLSRVTEAPDSISHARWDCGTVAQ